MSDDMAYQLIWMGLSCVVMLLGVNSNRWELYGISGTSFLLYALNYIPDMIGIIALALSVANYGRTVWCWLASRPNSR